ncbi:MAG: HEPN domain-containing protein [Planctomycetes bacterium]|nr:HEPN domain-containing protein [Planctomycetota bacterium]
MKEIDVLSAKAQTFIRSAEQVLSIGDYDSCASRCYYAMFLMTEAVLLTKELSASTHRGVISLFGEHFARTGIFEADMGTALNYAYKKRLVGDYGMGASVTQEEAEGLLVAARDFVGKVKDYLDRWAEQT